MENVEKFISPNQTLGFLRVIFVGERVNKLRNAVGKRVDNSYFFIFYFHIYPQVVRSSFHNRFFHLLNLPLTLKLGYQFVYLDLQPCIMLYLAFDG